MTTQWIQQLRVFKINKHMCTSKIGWKPGTGCLCLQTSSAKTKFLNPREPLKKSRKPRACQDPNHLALELQQLITETMGKRRLKHRDDRISDLPDAIIHQIFSLLPTNYMVSLTMVSKRFYQLCLSSPYLKFANNPLCDSSLKRVGFCGFVDNFMFDSNIHCFHLSLLFREIAKDNYAGEWSCLVRWIKQAVKSSVKELKLELNLPEVKPYGRFNLPMGISLCTIFTSKTLRVLKINIHQENLDLVDLPLVVFTSLQHLTLKNIRYRVCGSMSFSKWISSYCPSLKKLRLISVHDDSFKDLFELTHHVLENVKIVIGHIFALAVEKVSISCDNLRALSLTTRRPSYPLEIQISSPKLQSLEWIGFIVPRIELSSTDSLGTFTFLNSFPRQILNMAELPKLLISAKVIHLDISIIQSLLLIDHKTVVLDRLKDLVITIRESIEDYHIPVIDNFVRGMPNVVRLTIRQTKGYHDKEFEEEAREQLRRVDRATQRSEVFLKVKEMKIEFSNCEETTNFTKFVKHFLEKMNGLEKMIICYEFSSFPELSAFLEKSQKVASSKIEVISQLNNEPQSKRRYY